MHDDRRPARLRPGLPPAGTVRPAHDARRPPRPAPRPPRRDAPARSNSPPARPASTRQQTPASASCAAATSASGIATTQAEIDAAQALRYRVFYEEMGARARRRRRRPPHRDRDDFDAVADHLLVVDHAIGPGPEGVVGTYRLIRAEAAATARPLLLGRRIRHRPARSTSRARCWNSAAPACAPTIAAAPPCNCCGAASPPMCSSTDRPDVRLRQPARHRPRRGGRRADLSLSPPSRARRSAPARAAAPLRGDAPARPGDASTRARALAQLPPLIKGYLRLGGFVGDGAVIDAQFNTTDVAVVVKTDLVTDEYHRHYERQTARPWPSDALALFGRPGALRGWRAACRRSARRAGGRGAAAAAMPFRCCWSAMPGLLALIGGARGAARGAAGAASGSASATIWSGSTGSPRPSWSRRRASGGWCRWRCRRWRRCWRCSSRCPAPLALAGAGRAGGGRWCWPGRWVLADLARQFVATGFPWNPLGSVWAVPGAVRRRHASSRRPGSACTG